MKDYSRAIRVVVLRVRFEFLYAAKSASFALSR